MPNTTYSHSLAAIPAEALDALDAFSASAAPACADVAARAETWERSGKGTKASILRAMQSAALTRGALAGFEFTLREICERSAAESGRAVHLHHLSGEGIARSLLYLRVAAGFALADAEQPIERVTLAAARAGGEFQSEHGHFEVLMSDMREVLTALSREISSRVDKGKRDLQ